MPSKSMIGRSPKDKPAGKLDRVTAGAINRAAGSVQIGALRATRVHPNSILIHLDGSSVKQSFAEIHWDEDDGWLVAFEPPKFDLDFSSLARLLILIEQALDDSLTS